MDSEMPRDPLTPTSQPPSLLTGLPTELLLEIISPFRSSFHAFFPLVFQGDEDIAQRQAQHEALRALSQSCSILRLVCFPLLWERFDLSTHKLRGSDLKGELVPWVFPYIKSVHISMRRCSATENETLRVRQVVEFLGILPNLIAVRIQRVPLKMVAIISSAFGDTPLPTVTSLFVPAILHFIFPAFPNITTLACPSIFGDILAWAPAKLYFPRLAELLGLWVPGSEGLLSELARDFPRLRALSIASPFRGLFHLKNLCPFLLAFTELSELNLFHWTDHLTVKLLVSTAKDVLQASQSPDTKVLRIWSMGLFGLRLLHVERF
ncbi:hypothetical protein B0H19DRAFT_1185457 [Mycena capillaripes]|nr:hypothetical protein B0H19DRAFT_1185457 [Mycena capillaripes]